MYVCTSVFHSSITTTSGAGAGGGAAGVSDASRVSILRGCFRVGGWRSRDVRGVRSYHMTMCSCTLSITSTSSSSVMKSSVLSLRWCGPDISRSRTPEPGGAFASLARPRSPPPEKDWVGRRLDSEADEGGPLVERGSSSPVADDAETCEVRAGLLRRLRRVFVRRPACWAARPPASGKRNIPNRSSALDPIAMEVAMCPVWDLVTNQSFISNCNAKPILLRYRLRRWPNFTS